MNSDIIIRNFKLHILAGLELKEPFYSIYNDLKYIFTNINISNSKHSLDVILYKCEYNERLYVKYNKSTGFIHLFQELYSNFIEKYRITYGELAKVVKWYINNI